MRKLAAELAARGHPVSQEWVRQRLRGLHYSLQGNRKTREGGDHPDRDAQFAHINATASAYLAAGDPVISVDAKKKELVGDFKNSWPGVEAGGTAGGGAGLRLPHQGPGPGHALWGL